MCCVILWMFPRRMTTYFTHHHRSQNITSLHPPAVTAGALLSLSELEDDVLEKPKSLGHVERHGWENRTVDGEILHHHKDEWNPRNDGINHLSTGADFFPSTVSHVPTLSDDLLCYSCYSTPSLTGHRMDISKAFDVRLSLGGSVQWHDNCTSANDDNAKWPISRSFIWICNLKYYIMRFNIIIYIYIICIYIYTFCDVIIWSLIQKIRGFWQILTDSPWPRRSAPDLWMTAMLRTCRGRGDSNLHWGEKGWKQWRKISKNHSKTPNKHGISMGET